MTTRVKNEIINKYVDGQSVLSLSKEYGTNTVAIQNILDKNGVSKVSQAKRNNPLLVEDYFEKIDSPEKAYWIGWILTDGGVTKNSGLEISLQCGDEYILDMLQKDLKITNHVKQFCDKYYRFSFACKKMQKDLEQYGIVPNKTLTIKYPKNISDEYETHMLRGMFEGDGGLTVGVATRFSKQRGKSYTSPYRELSFTGTYDMCKGFHDALMKYAVFSPKNITRNRSMYRVRWSNINEVISILNVLYSGCGDHFLKRKYELYKQIEGMCA